MSISARGKKLRLISKVEAQTPLDRIGKPRDIAPVLGFLAPSDSGCTTGETLYISGGMR
jgi:3-oxoacyl-[acyl-carrier protein] reductase